MIIKYTQEQFENAKTRDFLELECQNCHNPFKLTKKRILEISKPYCNGFTGNFCGTKCSILNKKSKRINNVICSECNKSFYRQTKKIRQNHNFCSQSCCNKYIGRLKTKSKPPKPPKIIKPPKQQIKCLNCNNPTYNKKFCCGTCRNKVNNQNIKGSKSKAEKMLVEALKSNFPQWVIIENDRKILNGLELDVYIPEIKLAIEWNGIFHYEPIRGNQSLEKVISKDNKKIELCKQLGIELIVICDRTSHKKFIQETINQLINTLKKLAGTEGIAPS